MIVCWEGLIMKDEHGDLLELSTLWSALGSVVEQMPDDNFGDKEKVFFLGIWLYFTLIKKADLIFPPKLLKDQKLSSKGCKMSTLAHPGT